MIGKRSLSDLHATRYYHKQAVNELFEVRGELVQQRARAERAEDERDYWKARAEHAETEREAWEENHRILAEHFTRRIAEQPPQDNA